jgi:hypothetical protein
VGEQARCLGLWQPRRIDQMDLPAIFGKVPKSGVTKGDRSLPGLPTYEEWESSCGTDGARPALATSLRQQSEIFREGIKLGLEGEVREVALTMLMFSSKFIADLLLWMSPQYLHDRVRSGTTEKECWLFISHCVRTVFCMLGSAWMPGKCTAPGPKRPTSILWRTLQAIRKMQEMLKHGVSGYPELSHVLNLPSLVGQHCSQICFQGFGRSRGQAHQGRVIY